jgi:cysteine desulfurase family protein (TIGR01976 family)
MNPRAQFPALAGGFSFLDNAAGAQVPQACIDGITNFLSSASCNVGMPYPGSQLAVDVKAQARVETADFFNCKPSEVVIGTSATAITFMLARAFSRLWGPGDEVIISELEHEADASPWRNLEAQGVTVTIWRASWPDSRLDLEELRKLVSPRTKLVAVCSAANSLGTMPDVAGAAEIAHSVGAWCISDMVHYAPHHLPDVRATNVDFAFFSTYKVFGPHMAFLYVREGLLEKLPTDKLHFIPDDSPLKLEPGTQNHECLAGWLGTLAYLRELGGNSSGGSSGRAGMVAAYKVIQEIEQPLLEFTLEKLKAMPNIELYGEQSATGRVGTFCFNVKGQDPSTVAEQLGKAGVGVAAGNYYATMPMKALGLEGAIRASLLHYTSKEDLERLLKALDPD